MLIIYLIPPRNTTRIISFYCNSFRVVKQSACLVLSLSWTSMMHWASNLLESTHWWQTTLIGRCWVRSMLYTHGLAQLLMPTYIPVTMNACVYTTKQNTTQHPNTHTHTHTHTTVRKVIPLLAESREVRIEHPLIRTGGHKTLLKTSHLCQWLESAASYYATLTAQSSLHKQGK